jgi:hypothetical protein
VVGVVLEKSRTSSGKEDLFILTAAGNDRTLGFQGEKSQQCHRRPITKTSFSLTRNMVDMLCGYPPRRRLPRSSTASRGRVLSGEHKASLKEREKIQQQGGGMESTRRRTWKGREVEGSVGVVSRELPVPCCTPRSPNKGLNCSCFEILFSDRVFKRQVTDGSAWCTWSRVFWFYLGGL